MDEEWALVALLICAEISAIQWNAYSLLICSITFTVELHF